MPLRLPLQSVRMGRHSYRGDVVTYDPRTPLDVEPRVVEMAAAVKPGKVAAPRGVTTKTTAKAGKAKK